MKEALSAASNGSFLITRRDIIINLLLGLHRLPIAQIILRIFFVGSFWCFERNRIQSLSGATNDRMFPNTLEVSQENVTVLSMI